MYFSPTGTGNISLNFLEIKKEKGIFLESFLETNFLMRMIEEPKYFVNILLIFSLQVFFVVFIRPLGLHLDSHNFRQSF